MLSEGLSLIEVVVANKFGSFTESLSITEALNVIVYRFYRLILSDGLMIFDAVEKIVHQFSQILLFEEIFIFEIFIMRGFPAFQVNLLVEDIIFRRKFTPSLANILFGDSVSIVIHRPLSDQLSLFHTIVSVIQGGAHEFRVVGGEIISSPRIVITKIAVVLAIFGLILILSSLKGR